MLLSSTFVSRIAKSYDSYVCAVCMKIVWQNYVKENMFKLCEKWLRSKEQRTRQRLRNEEVLSWLIVREKQPGKLCDVKRLRLHSSTILRNTLVPCVCILLWIFDALEGIYHSTLFSRVYKLLYYWLYYWINKSVRGEGWKKHDKILKRLLSVMECDN